MMLNKMDVRVSKNHTDLRWTGANKVGLKTIDKKGNSPFLVLLFQQLVYNDGDKKS